LLAATAVLYLWGLGASGWANAFYSAAVQAATKSWKAMFFGAFDSSNFITVDKPPAALWIMGISARIFGVNAWSMLVPEALEGVAAVGLLYATVRRRFGPSAGLLAGAELALTPVAVLMFRFNNPDALLTLLLVGAAYALTRALEGARTRWLILVGALIGFAFLTKMLQAFLVVPAFGLVYLIAAPTSLWRRAGQLLAGGVAMFVSAGWWIAAVTLWPASARPYIGGSQTNSVLELVFGYNGFGRLTGNETGSVGGGAVAGSRWGPTGLLRLFSSDMGGQISWLLPAALVFFVALLWFTRRARRTDQRWAAVLMWGGWLFVTGAVFSLAQGIIHPYYNVALAPAIAALAGIGAVSLWRRRDRVGSRIVLSVAVATTAVWSFVLLDRSPAWHPWLRVAVLVAGLVAAVLLIVPRLRGRLMTAVAAVAIASSLAGPLAYSLSTAATPTPAPSPRRARRSLEPAAAPAGSGARLPEVSPADLARASASVAALRRASLCRRSAGAAARTPVLVVVLAASADCSTRARRTPPWWSSSRRMPVSTSGSRRPSDRTARPASSWPRANPSWLSAASTVRTRLRRSPSSRRWSAKARSTTSSGAVGSEVEEGSAAQPPRERRARSRPGCSSSSPREPSAAPLSTT